MTLLLARKAGGNMSNREVEIQHKTGVHTCQHVVAPPGAVWLQNILACGFV